MPVRRRLQSWQCSCERFADLVCDWPMHDGLCRKPICRQCARQIEGKDYCPFHRGDPPEIAERNRLAAEKAAQATGEEEARKLARLFGLKDD